MRLEITGDGAAFVEAGASPMVEGALEPAPGLAAGGVVMVAA